MIDGQYLFFYLKIGICDRSRRIEANNLLIITQNQVGIDCQYLKWVDSNNRGREENVLEIYKRVCIPFYLRPNVLFTLNRTKHSSKTLLCVVRINVNKTLFSQARLVIPAISGQHKVLGTIYKQRWQQGRGEGSKIDQNC